MLCGRRKLISDKLLGRSLFHSGKMVPGHVSFSVEQEGGNYIDSGFYWVMEYLIIT